MVKRTYNLEEETMADFESRVPAGQRGIIVNQAIEHWLEEQRRLELRVRILEGLKDAENEALSQEVEREWSPLSNEIWGYGQGEEWPEPAIVWSDGLKAERAKHGDQLDA